MSLHVQIPVRGKWATALCTGDPVSAERFGARLRSSGNPVRIVTAGHLCLETLTRKPDPVPVSRTRDMREATRDAMKEIVFDSDTHLCIKGDDGRWSPINELERVAA